MNKIGIERIIIRNFLSQYDIDIPLSGPMKIFIGENGMGKTQILNIIYCILSRNFEKLKAFNFEEIEIVFDSESKKIINKSMLEFENSKLLKSSRSQIDKLIEVIGFPKFQDLINRFELNKPSRVKFKNLVSEYGYGHNWRINPDFLYDALRDYYFIYTKSHNDQINLFVETSNDLEIISDLIRDRVGHLNILYFPTFRRVEEELKNLGYDEDSFIKSKEDNRLIHFGMDDVQRRFDTFTGIIDRLSKEGFAKLSSEILSQLVKGIPATNSEFIERINAKDVQIILERIGKEMSVEDKEKILTMINNKEVKNQDPFLLYFLEKLFDIYDQQREYDSYIKDFQSICNSYLVHKELFYDENGMKIYIKNTITDSKILLSKLSSGEKQIISMLSRIYLSRKEQKYIVLFDEPELSLSIFWQRKLLPDIINSGKCAFLLAVTHSPFIFENELDKFAISLHEYYTTISNDIR